MFSEQHMVQEIVALLVALAALLYVVRRLTGWPGRSGSPGASRVDLGERLARGLKSIEKKRP